MTSARPARSTVRHGMASCARYGCTRPECRAAQTRARGATRADLRQGIRATVPTDAATAHAQRLRHAGMPIHDIATRTGLSATTVSSVVTGRKPTIYRDTADAILALPIPQRGYKTGHDGLIDATAARRRLRALSALGFTLPVLAAQAGVTTETIGSLRQGRRRQLRVSVDQVITEVYDRLWKANPLDYGAPLAGVIRAKAWAVKQGWPPPAAWDDDELRNPLARPAGYLAVRRRKAA